MPLLLFKLRYRTVQIRSFRRNFRFANDVLWRRDQANGSECEVGDVHKVWRPLLAAVAPTTLPVCKLDRLRLLLASLVLALDDFCRAKRIPLLTQSEWNDAKERWQEHGPAQLTTWIIELRRATGHVEISASETE